MTDPVRRSRTAFLWIGVIVPLAVLTVSTLVLLAWLPELPDPAATHWSGGGGPDGFGPAWTYPAILAGVGGGLVVLLWLMVLVSHRRASPTLPAWSATGRLLGAMSLGIAGMLSSMILVSVGVQRGLADAADAPDITGWVLLGFVLLAALTVLGWFLQPPVPPTAPQSEAVEPLPLAPGERAMWARTATMGAAGQVVLALALVALVAQTAVLLAQSADSWWITGLVTVLLAAFVAAGLAVRVRVDPAGLVVRSLLGWPRTTIPAAAVKAVRVVRIDPFGQFGGWGWRMGLDGRRGFVLRAGEGLEVARTDGRVFVVTVDDAATAAALLASYAPAGRASEESA